MKWIQEPDNISQIFDREVINVECKPIGKVPNVLLASALVKESHSPILGMLEIHGFQI